MKKGNHEYFWRGTVFHHISVRGMICDLDIFAESVESEQYRAIPSTMLTGVVNGNVSPHMHLFSKNTDLCP